MSLESYVSELEKLIVTKYIPVYKLYYEEKGEIPKLDKLSIMLLSKKISKEIPALLKPRDKNEQHRDK